MRPVRLARIAAEAELVRLRGMATRIVTRVIFAVVALLFLVGVLVFIHLAGWYGLRAGLRVSFPGTIGIMAGIDLLIALILLFLASRSSPSRVETEAREVRRKAIEGITTALSLTQLAVPVLRLATGRRRRRR